MFLDESWALQFRTSSYPKPQLNLCSAYILIHFSYVQSSFYLGFVPCLYINLPTSIFLKSNVFYTLSASLTSRDHVSELLLLKIEFCIQNFTEF